MKETILKALEEKYNELKWELDLPMDEFVKEQIEKQLNDTYSTIKFFKDLEGKDEFIQWKL